MGFSKGISEIVLVVDDVMEVARFYEDVVQLTPETEATEEWAWFWAGEPGHSQRIALRHGPLLFEEYSPHRAKGPWGCVHYALEVDRQVLDNAVEHVRSRGVTVFGPERFDWMGAMSYFFYDPAGNLLEFWSPE